MNTIYVLPKDLNDALKNLENSIISSLKLSSFRFTIEFNFEGLKFNKIGITIYKILANYYNNKKIKKNVFLTYSDPGAVALAQRDYPDIKENIFTFKGFNESIYVDQDESILISILPQPYDFDTFEPMCDNFKGLHYSLNPKFEDANIGIGSVIRERRKNFVKTWYNVYFLQPIDNGALMHSYPNNWLLFKEINKRYLFKKEFDERPDNETIFVNL